MRFIKNKALEITENKYPGNLFKASNGWFFNFLKRKRISRRVATHVMQKISSDFSKEIITFWKEVKR
jgi:hypothetical protein